MRRLVPVTYILSALFVIAGLLFWVLPVGGTAASDGVAGSTGLSPDSSLSALKPAMSVPVDSASAVVSRNIFSPERVPPRVRFVPPSSEPVEPIVAVPVAPSAPPLPRVFGITLRASDSTALIDADPRVPGAEIYRVGDEIGDAIIVEISDSVVVIDGPRGRRSLRLETRQRP